MEEEILYQLVDGKHPNVIPWNLQCFVVPNSCPGAGFRNHPQYLQ